MGNGRNLDKIRPAQLKKAAGKDQLKNQQERHDRHGRGRGPDNTGDHQRHGIRRESDQQQGDSDIHDSPGCDDAGLGEMNARQTADQQRNQGLQKTEDQLVKHVGRDIGRHTHTGTMFLFNNLPLPADDLDRVKETVPYTDTRQGEGTRGRSFLCYKHIGADHKGDQGGYNGADRQHDPVALIDKHPQEFPEINPGLADPSNIPQLFSGRICHDVCPPFFAAA